MFFRLKKSPFFIITALVVCMCAMGTGCFHTFATASDTPQENMAAAPKNSGVAKPAQKLDTGNNKKSKPVSSSQQNTAENAKVKEQLDIFAKRKLALINQGLRPGKNSKEVTKRNGMFVARYIQVHPETLKTRFRSNTSNPPVRYVGFLQYQESHYECQAKTKEKALKGPFSVVRLRNMTEIIMYDNHGWHD